MEIEDYKAKQAKDKSPIKGKMEEENQIKKSIKKLQISDTKSSMAPQ